MTTFEEGKTGVLSGMRVIDFTLGQQLPPSMGPAMGEGWR